MNQTIQIPATKELKRKLSEQAKALGLSLAAYARLLLIKGSNEQSAT